LKVSINAQEKPEIYTVLACFKDHNKTNSFSEILTGAGGEIVT
jgi:hypothetical protein